MLDKNQFAIRLDAAILARGFNNTSFGQAACPKSGRILVLRWLRGKAVPTADMLASIAKTLDVTTDWLLGLTETGGVDLTATAQTDPRRIRPTSGDSA
jgi:transcriptional regulator with XRE-family HTH domain